MPFPSPIIRMRAHLYTVNGVCGLADGVRTLRRETLKFVYSHILI